MLSLIVAVAQNNVIGKDNALIWHLPDDLKHFKEITSGKTIIMGRKTFESLGRVLPKRKHVVLCKSGSLEVDDDRVEILKDISELDKYIEDSEEHFVIGGATIYKLLLDKVNKMYITRINEDFEGDAFFPQFDEKEWKITEKIKGPRNSENPYDYDYITYERI
ncbi:MAG: dihydrofolate reductase [Clostridia bacterium]|nr:dihydrofolate reductase [Clostridia bacterium]